MQVPGVFGRIYTHIWLLCEKEPNSLGCNTTNVACSNIYKKKEWINVKVHIFRERFPNRGLGEGG